MCFEYTGVRMYDEDDIDWLADLVMLDCWDKVPAPSLFVWILASLTTLAALFIWWMES